MMVYKVSSDGHTIEDFDPHAFEDDAIIVFPSEIDGKKITGIRMPYKTKTALNSLFGSFDVIIEDGIKDIQEHMFEETKIRQITIPASVETIPSHCFWDSKLEKVVFKEESLLKTIGENAFALCKDLSSISLPSTVTTIGDKAFKDCGLKEIDLSECKDGLNIGEYAFSECTWLKLVLLPEAEVTIGKYAFYYCEALEDVQMFKSDIETIPEGAFLHDKLLKLAPLPPSVTDIRQRAFSNCDLLQTVGLGFTKVREIGNNAFSECFHYSDYMFPKTLESIGNQAFIRCKLNKLELPLFTLQKIGNEVFVGNPIDGEIDLRPFIGCDKIGDNIFASTNVESVLLLPFSGVNVSARYMFDSCNRLKEVKMLAASALYEGMFNSCSNLETVTLPETLKKIPQYAFRMTKKLKKINFPSSLKSIDYGAFYLSGINCLDLSKSDSMFIDALAFKGVTLKSINLPFYGCRLHAISFEKETFDLISDDSPFFSIVN